MENQPPNIPTAPQKTNDLAVASLVLALLGFIFYPLTTIPAIICGHIARSRFRKGIAVSGSEMALAGIIIGYALTALFVILVAPTVVFYFKVAGQTAPHFQAASPQAMSSIQAFTSRKTDFPNVQIGTEAYRGAMLFQQKGCVQCHRISEIDGTPAIIVGSDEKRGSDLTDVADRLTSEKMTDFIVHGGSNMPAFGTILKPDEIKAIVVFLSTLHR